MMQYLKASAMEEGAVAEAYMDGGAVSVRALNIPARDLPLRENALDKVR